MGGLYIEVTPKSRLGKGKNNEVKGSAVFNLQNVECEVAHIL